MQNDGTNNKPEIEIVDVNEGRGGREAIFLFENASNAPDCLLKQIVQDNEDANAGHAIERYGVVRTVETITVMTALDEDGLTEVKVKWAHHEPEVFDDGRVPLEWRNPSLMRGCAR